MFFVLSSSVGGSISGSVNSDTQDRKDVIDSFDSDEEEKSKEQLMKFAHMSSGFHVNQGLLKVKILNFHGETLIKWQGNAFQVKRNAIAFMKKASNGRYQMNAYHTDGSFHQYIIEK